MFPACHNAGKRLIKRIVNTNALSPKFPPKTAEAYKYVKKSTE
jgi:hypothetical protein